ncbi:pyridoxal-dependent decarboxylase, exosortase A system-associated [Massilia sp. G4R7]|uniref:Pyridoxal-dependent decarboxylase, exosortase A system-associated n=1 Tax=Massilia phyllostachyos TaxID=2898585 RepID=A0ABS8QCB5_9BURK|nr:pyridoxal-dependent decarboxylase, exosortase A system-associated [Massilia phyllostachyos]MCD2519398.1 pyridoxal-dependent decarboxylase, exosortase A system-associated [Massilia phyllostachyos]
MNTPTSSPNPNPAAPGAKPVHAAQIQFPVVDNCLQVGGIALTRLAQRVGATPFYAYDRALLTRRVEALRASLPAQLELHYSVKANPMPAVVQHLAGLVDGLDVASGGELRVALDTGMAPQRISFAGPGKSEAELAQAVAAGACVHAESEREIRVLARLGEQLGIAPRLVLRINPDFELKGSGMRMGGGAKQFGIDAEDAPRLLALCGALGLDVLGFHIFSGSQSLRSAAIVEAQAQTFELALRLAQASPSPVRMLNIGGGFGIPYFPGEARLELAPIGAALAAALPRMEAALPEAVFSIELGRYLVGEAGVYVARVIDRKVSRGQVFLVTDGGLHHHLAASGNFGQVIRKNYPVAIGNRMESGRREAVSVVGPLCTPLDLLAERMELPQAEVGDLVVVFQSGAYGLSASPGGFLSHPAALEVLV